MDAFLLDKIVDGLGALAVDDIAFHFAAETAVQLVNADVALAEAGYHMGLADALELGFHFVLVVRLVELDHNLCGGFAQGLLCNIHNINMC